jgi:chromosome segregation ATPase
MGDAYNVTLVEKFETFYDDSRKESQQRIAEHERIITELRGVIASHMVEAVKAESEVKNLQQRLQTSQETASTRNKEYLRNTAEHESQMRLLESEIPLLAAEVVKAESELQTSQENAKELGRDFREMQESCRDVLQQRMESAEASSRCKDVVIAVFVTLCVVSVLLGVVGFYGVMAIIDIKGQMVSTLK